METRVLAEARRWLQNGPSSQTVQTANFNTHRLECFLASRGRVSRVPHTAPLGRSLSRITVNSRRYQFNRLALRKNILGVGCTRSKTQWLVIPCFAAFRFPLSRSIPRFDSVSVSVSFSTRKNTSRTVDRVPDYTLHTWYDTTSMNTVTYTQHCITPSNMYTPLCMETNTPTLSTTA